jgi:hypothetical protein
MNIHNQSSGPSDFGPPRPVFHLFREAPQHMRAARVASVRPNFFRLLSPGFLCAWSAPRLGPRASASGTRESGCPITIKANRRLNQCRGLCVYPGPLGLFFTFFAHRPNTRLPHELRSFREGLCHLMSPCVFARAAPPTRGGATVSRAGCPRYPGGVGLADTHVKRRSIAADQPRRRRLWAGACMTLGMATRSGQVMMST